jgi:carbamoyl-phosphate synthase large subunit
LKKLKIVVTACGCPGASTLIRMLKNNGERDIEIIGVDMDNQAIGRFLTERFYQVPAGHTEEFIHRMLEIIKKESPDVVFPESSNEVYNLACNKERFEQLGTKVIVSAPEAIETANNKYKMYEVLKNSTDISLPAYRMVNSAKEFTKAIEDLGYPSNPVIFKPPVGKGSRGVRIIDPLINRKDHLLKEKPTSKYMSLEEFQEIFFQDEDFPPLFVMEFLKGQEYTADAISLNGKALLTTIKTVEQARWGVIVKGELVTKPNLVEQAGKILTNIPLSYCSNIQFIEDKLIEINPRVSGFIYQDNLIAPYISIKLALGEISPEEVIDMNSRIDYGRRMVRYMDQVFFTP